MFLIRCRIMSVVVLVAICAAQSSPPSTASSQKTAEQVYKNIQVLKGMPADQLIPTMQFIAASLGAQCDFCHLENAFEKDDKETKQTARKMMRMVFAINKDNFEGQKKVTCYACHRGAYKPVVTPVISGEPVEGMATEGDNHDNGNTLSLPSADKIIDQYVQAIGRMRFTTESSVRLEKGTVTVGTAQFPVEVLTKGLANRVTTVHFPGGDSVTGFNAQAGWMSTPGRGPHEMSPAELDGARMDVLPQTNINIKQIFKELRVQRPEKVNGRLAYVVSGMRDNRPPVQLYFDQESGLLVRLLRYVDTPIGLNPTEIDYADYREEGGAKIPFRWTIARSRTRFTVQIEQIQQGIRVDDERFAPPKRP
jgi:photosynthetic reaction center cytochrome c subunit